MSARDETLSVAFGSRSVFTRGSHMCAVHGDDVGGESPLFEAGSAEGLVRAKCSLVRGA